MRTIYNLPETANEYKYIVVNDVEGELWYYGAWNEQAKAERVAYEINGEVIYK